MEHMLKAIAADVGLLERDVSGAVDRPERARRQGRNV
jgi:hypothetical protein